MEKKMETTGEKKDSIGLYTDYRVYLGVFYIGTMEKKMETTIIQQGI